VILYLDASALVKRYVVEIGSAEIEKVNRQLWTAAEQAGLIPFPANLSDLLDKRKR
jgi:hypothetical protein